MVCIKFVRDVSVIHPSDCGIPENPLFDSVLQIEKALDFFSTMRRGFKNESYY